MQRVAVEENVLRTGNEYSLREVLRTLATCVREFRFQSMLTPMLVFCEVVIECVIPFFTSNLIDQITEGAGMDVVAQHSVVLVILAILSLMFGTLAGITASNASAGFAKNLRHDLFANILNFSFSNIDHFTSSSLVTRLTTDVTNVQLAFMQIIRSAVRGPLMCIFAVVMAFITAGPMASIFLVVAFILGGVIFGIALWAMPIFRRIFRKYDQLNDSVKENIDGIRVVKSYVREDYERVKFNNTSESLFHNFLRVERILALNTPVMVLCLDIVYFFVIYFGSKAIVTSQGTLMQIGNVNALLTYSFSMMNSLMMLSMVFVMVTMAEESSYRLCEVLKEESDITSPDNPIYTVADGSIDFNNVSFVYEGRKNSAALADIDLHIKSGEVIGVIGTTGSSKTTLIQLISRLYDVTEGSVKVGGIDVRNYDLKTLRDQVAVVLQRNQLFSGTIKENLRWGNPDATDEEMIEACKLAQADEFIQRFPDGYDTYITQGGTNVSGGQKQRLCIARALLKNPKVLILDDSTSAVDTHTDRLIRKGFRSYIPSTTKIIIAERTSSIDDADRIVVLNNGRIDAIGTADELLRTNDIYREIYLTQNKESHDAKLETIAFENDREQTHEDTDKEGEVNIDE